MCIDLHQTGSVGEGRVTISSCLNYGHPATLGKGSAAGQKFVAPPYYSQCAVFASLRALFHFICALSCPQPYTMYMSRTTMARYSVFVLKVPLNTKQPTNQPCIILPSGQRFGFRIRHHVFAMCCSRLRSKCEVCQFLTSASRWVRSGGWTARWVHQSEWLHWSRQLTQLSPRHLSASTQSRVMVPRSVPFDFLNSLSAWLPVIVNDVDVLYLLGRLPKVDLIILEGENVRPYVRPSVHKKFLKFQRNLVYR